MVVPTTTWIGKLHESIVKVEDRFGTLARESESESESSSLRGKCAQTGRSKVVLWNR
jgi:hypothetical protein